MLAITFLFTAIILFVIAVAGKKAGWDAEEYYKLNLGFSFMYALAFVGQLIFY